jgi:glycosyltransferase involved in cell wall biosynthesis
MTGTPATFDAKRPLRVLHVLRAPVGGLFRHVVDLASGQAARGHRVGIVADATTGGAPAEAALAALAPKLALGLTRVPMSRQIGAHDPVAVLRIGRVIAQARPDVVHGHGAKGAAYARLARSRGAIRVYTPHGGSLHYDPATISGQLYLGLERLLARRTDLFLFESAYSREVFRAKIGEPPGLARVVHNGVAPAELVPVRPAPDAADVLFVGELRLLKGVDVLIEALASLRRSGTPLTAVIVGTGAEQARFEASARAQGLAEMIRFVGAMPAREAFALGRRLAVPSRAESLPYIVLEAGAAGVPMIATRAGGIAEIFGPDSASLVAPGDPEGLARAIAASLREPAAAQLVAERLKARIAAVFSTQAMTEAILSAYCEALDRASRP